MKTKSEQKLTKVQKRALEKLDDKWRSAYSLQENLKTLDILVEKGFAEEYWPTWARNKSRHTIRYRLKQRKYNET